ncbi:flagellar hook-length control protein FliK [Vibrio sp. DW001]|uniref:flagellar hook-length control protein FliK n=1 Tax=Vibrio sp. DW001 TaxID=2912315 RepID=UPI0023AF3702|nr:flagellar hook-length control protein FliK [Vibrio sp. DW001]WED25875.1 flagellar hook-length control protein FliK [Vibrio sp. DW001]
MNQTSLSVSDVGKTSTRLQTGASDAIASTDSTESGSFLSALGAIFQSETESTEDTQVIKTDVSEAEVSVPGVDTLIDDDVAVEGEGEGDENAKAKPDSESSQSSSAESDEAVNRLPLSDTSPDQEKAAKTMSEGNELLERLDDSSHALKNEDGKLFPQESKSAEEASNKREEDPALSQFIEKSTSQNQDTVQRQDSKMTGQLPDEKLAQSESLESSSQSIPSLERNGQEENIELDQVGLMGKQSQQKDENTSANEAVGASGNRGVSNELQKEFVLQNGKDATQQLEHGATQQSLKEQVVPAEGAVASQGKPIPQSTEELIWGNTQTDVETEETLATIGIASVGTVLAKADKAQIEATMAQLNLSDADIEALSPEELEYLIQVTNSNVQPEQLKASAELAKPTAVATAAAQQLHTPQYLQQHAAQTQSLDKAPLLAQTSVTAAELNNAQLHQTQPFNPTQVMVATNANSQQHMMKTALATAGVAGAMKSGNKSDDKESGLSQQLSGLAAQQGLQQAQLKTGIQQAVQQSPLQLSREVAGEKLSDQVQMMLSKNLKNIDIRLDPPELGRMQIRMTMNGDAASVQFTVANQQARDIVEQAMPRLREMLAQQGLQLSDSSVHQQNSGQQQGQYASNESNNPNGTNGLLGEGGGNVDESINLDVNIKSKDDGISFYA